MRRHAERASFRERRGTWGIHPFIPVLPRWKVPGPVPPPTWKMSLCEMGVASQGLRKGLRQKSGEAERGACRRARDPATALTSGTREGAGMSAEAMSLSRLFPTPSLFCANSCPVPY